jgi:hypothetical protein
MVFNLIAVCVTNWGNSFSNSFLSLIFVAFSGSLSEEYAMVLNLGSGWLLAFNYGFVGIFIGVVFRFSIGGNITKIFADAGN